MIKILSLPSRHPYMSKFHNRGEIKFINPKTDYFNKIGGIADPAFIDKKHKPSTYDLIHIHFSFDKLSLRQLNNLLEYFKKNNKPIVWTCHSRTSQRKKDSNKGELQRILFQKSDAVITLTDGCKKWLIKEFGENKKSHVIKHGYIMDPNNFYKYKENIKKKKKQNFVYLVGDFRENKELKKPILAFLNEPKLNSCKLKIIHHTPIKKELNYKFLKSISNNERIQIISKHKISNDFLNKIFCESHVCFLPYLWGTHSGQVELCRDCGCHPVISNVGFYKEQYKQSIVFNKDKNSKEFTNNFLSSVIETYTKETKKPNPDLRKNEFQKILKKHIDLYRKLV